MYCHQCEALRFLFRDFISQTLNKKGHISMTDFISAFNKKYLTYSKELFCDRFIPELRNSVSHNNIFVDNEEKIIQYHEY